MASPDRPSWQALVRPDPALARLVDFYWQGPRQPINVIGPNDAMKAVIALALLEGATSGQAAPGHLITARTASGNLMTTSGDPVGTPAYPLANPPSPAGKSTSLVKKPAPPVVTAERPVVPARPCFLVADELRARTLAADLKALTGDAVLVFRPRELNLTDAEAVSHEMEHRRLAMLSQLLSGDFGALIVPAAAAIQKLMPQADFTRATLRLQTGGQWPPDQLSEQLTALGYERVRLVEAAGQFARRGDIIDIGLTCAEDRDAASGLRLSFFDIELDAIKQFDLESQRSLHMLDQVLIPPAREMLVPANQRESVLQAMQDTASEVYRQAISQGTARDVAEGLRQMARRDCERLDQHATFAGLDRWLAILYPEADSILDYARAAGCRFFIDEPLRVRNRLDAAQAEFDERCKTLLSKAQVLPQTGHAMFRGADISRWIDQHGQFVALCQIASSGNGLPGGQTLDINGRDADSYRGRESHLIGEIRDWQQQGRTVLLFAGSDSRQQRLHQMLADEGLRVPVYPAALNHGFVYPAAGLLLIGTQDIFGSERVARRRSSQGIRIDLFSDLVPGEMVVHEAHGIGRYDGLVNLESGGVRRDYLQISYAGNDTLYIPMESLDQIQKYVGAEGREPRLSRLGGQDWTRLKEKARESIRKLATDLLKLYAERQARRGHRFAADTVWQQEFEDGFPYEETADQLRSIVEIKQDMENERVMDRLLCGDVGFGKTEVAFRAVFKCVMDGLQAAILAPTTVLAQQHYENLQRRLAGYPVNIGLLSRFANDAMQKNTLKGLANGQVDVVVGTHRLLSADVRFKNLGLLVVDEEQRFGVDHKEKIKSSHAAVDVLTLTATPIPRTLHMAMSGIRDISVLEEPPHDRRPVQTYVMEYDRDIITEAILRELSRQGQVFYLFNDTRRILEKVGELEKLLPGARIVYAHGKMGEKRLEEIINSFIAGEADLLVCTTIIESGIDMPHVNTIIIEDADRLGLAQLYQLRGRVGRSDRQAFAYVTYRRDKILTEIAEKRLAAIRDFTELGAGFKIALRDLEVRGAGNLLGAEQHGHLDAIGYDLYCKMLEEAIHDLQGQPVARKVAAVIDLDVDAYLPRSYIPDEGQRMDMYRRIAAIDNFQDYQDVLDEMLDRFGEPPAEAVALTDIALVRARASRFGFAKIESQHENLILAYAESPAPDMQLLSGLLATAALKGRLLFNAGNRPYLVYRAAARERARVTTLLRQLFWQADQVVTVSPARQG